MAIVMTNDKRIRPYSANPRYWQYKGAPVLLLGGSKTDHIFLADSLEAHLAGMKAVGANYVRCTMSQREAKELKPHKLLPDGRFDLDQWNEEYWRRFEKMLEWTAARDIVVQIEVWDRFDFSRENWLTSPWNPDRNINYTRDETGLAAAYPEHPGRDSHPFFHTIPGMPMYEPRLDRVRTAQERFVANILKYSLKHGHVLYCMNNETSTPPEWGRYWISAIRESAAKAGVAVYTTDMFDDGWRGKDAEHIRVIFDAADVYTFADISQVNSRSFQAEHWSRMQWLLREIGRRPRPVNNVKIYGGGYARFGTGGPEDGVERFWRNLVGGCAAVRFHRPKSGNGLNERAKACIRAARKLESVVRPWDVEPHMELLVNNEPNRAYAAAKPGEQYVVYFPNGGPVELDLRESEDVFDIRWISVGEGDWGDQVEKRIQGGSVVRIGACYDRGPYRHAKVRPWYSGGWVAVITRANGD